MTLIDPLLSMVERCTSSTGAQPPGHTAAMGSWWASFTRAMTRSPGFIEFRTALERTRRRKGSKGASWPPAASR